MIPVEAGSKRNIKTLGVKEQHSVRSIFLSSCYFALTKKISLLVSLQKGQLPIWEPLWGGREPAATSTSDFTGPAPGTNSIINENPIAVELGESPRTQY